MLTDYDYRFCIKASLQVMSEGRQKICYDTFNREYLIYMGLYESDPVKQDLYFQYYEIKWLEQHWINMQTILEKHMEYSKDQRRQMILFFAKNYSEMIDKWKNSGQLSNLIIPNILQELENAIQELLHFSENCDKNMNKLKLMLQKSKKQFEELISQRDESV